MSDNGDSCLHRPPACSAFTSRRSRKLSRAPQRDEKHGAMCNDKTRKMHEYPTTSTRDNVKICQQDITKVASSHDVMDFDKAANIH